MNNVIATWSGGKDSCFAAYKATQSGHHISYLANTISHDYYRVRFHGLKAELIQAQAKAIGIPLLQRATHPERYEEEFKANLRRGMSSDVTGLVFGDIHLEDCFAWAKRVADSLGLEAIEPLWHVPQAQILQELVDAGFQAVVVSTQADRLGKEWVGRTIDESFLDEISSLPGVDACGENGEYHSVVVDGPLFYQRLELVQTESVLRDGYWFLDIQDYRLADKAIRVNSATSPALSQSDSVT